jgi:hypothetical protein
MYLADAQSFHPGSWYRIARSVWKIDVVGTNVVLSQSDDRSLKTDFAVVVEDGLKIPPTERHEFRR